MPLLSRRFWQPPIEYCPTTGGSRSGEAGDHWRSLLIAAICGPDLVARTSRPLTLKTHAPQRDFQGRGLASETALRLFRKVTPGWFSAEASLCLTLDPIHATWKIVRSSFSS